MNAMADEATAKLEEMEGVMTQLTEKVEALTTENATLKSANEKLTADAATATAKAGMDDEEREYFEGMSDEDDKKKYLAADRPARKAAIAKAKAGDETLVV